MTTYSKGTKVVVQWHNDVAQFHTTTGVVAGYEAHVGARAAIFVDDSHRNWIPLDAIVSIREELSRCEHGSIACPECDGVTDDGGDDEGSESDGT